MAEGRDPGRVLRSAERRFVSCGLLLVATLAGTTLRAQNLRSALDEAVTAAESSSGSLGVHLVEMASSETVFERRADEPLDVVLRGGNRNPPRNDNDD